MKERWKKIRGWPYEISDYGKVKSIGRIVKHNGINKNYFRKERVLKQKINLFGYPTITLQFNKNKKYFFVHKLVGIYFLKKEKNKNFINHKDCEKINNHFLNLEWVTASENMLHAHKNNRYPSIKGEKHHLSKLSDKDVLKIKSFLAKKTKVASDLAKIFNVSLATISLIKNGKTWRHLKEK